MLKSSHRTMKFKQHRKRFTCKHCWSVRDEFFKFIDASCFNNFTMKVILFFGSERKKRIVKNIVFVLERNYNQAQDFARRRNIEELSLQKGTNIFYHIANLSCTRKICLFKCAFQFLWNPRGLTQCARPASKSNSQGRRGLGAPCDWPRA